MMPKIFIGAKLEKGERDYGKALIDAGIMAGGAFLGALTAEAFLGDSKLILLKAFIAAGSAFFATLIASLNIKKGQPM